MNEQTQTPAEEATEDASATPAQQLERLRERARMMGIKFSGNTGIDTLRAKINAQLDGTPDEADDANEEDADEDETDVEATVDDDDDAEPAEIEEEAPIPVKAVQKKPQAKRARTRQEIVMETRLALRKEMLALVRCKIHCLNPAKADLHGEIITVGNKYLGSVRRMIPYATDDDNGTHVERILLEDLKSRKFQQIKTRKKGGKIEVLTKDVPEFNIELLTPLTRAELKELALAQQAAERVGV
jgi:hypothetical protein